MNFQRWGAIGLAALVATIAVPAHALPKPKLKVQELSSGDIRINISFARGVVLPKGSVIRLRRAVDLNSFQNFKTISPAKLKVTVVDASPSDGIYSYRARVEKKKTQSSWSSEASVIVANGAVDGGSGGGTGDLVAGPTGPAPLLNLPSNQSLCPPNFGPDVVALVNVERQKVGLGALQGQANLDYSANLHSSKMILAGFISHDNWFEEIMSCNFQGSSFGQNVAQGFPLPSAVVTAWMASSAHKSNILKASYTFLGVGCVQDSGGNTWWTQNFGG